jgi:tetratricopeptide (TPR) repeat protein
LRRINLVYVNVALLIALAILIPVYRDELSWARHALPGYLSGDLPSLEEVDLADEGLAILRDGGDPAQAQQRLESSLAIDPNLYARHTLGEAYLLAGDLEAARIQFEVYHQLDPTFLPTYLRLIDVYDLLDRSGEADGVLREGIDYYRANTERYIPQPDDSVADVFNTKAQALYNSYHESLRILQDLERSRNIRL